MATKRGRQGQCHIVSIAGCHRSYCIDSQSGMLIVLEVRGGDGTSTQPQAQQASNAGRLRLTTQGGIREGANQDERPPSGTQWQGVRASVSERERDTATLSLSQDASGSDCRDYKSTQMTESWKREEGDRVHPATRLGKSPRNCTQGKYEVWTRRSQGN